MKSLWNVKFFGTGRKLVLIFTTRNKIYYLNKMNEFLSFNKESKSSETSMGRHDI